MGKRAKDHAILVAREESNKDYVRRFYETSGFFPSDRIITSQYYSKNRLAPMSYKYKDVLARGKEYRQLHKVDPNFDTYAGKVNN